MKSGIELDGWNLVCPRCGEMFLHHDHVEIFQRPHEDEAARVIKVVENDIIRGGDDSRNPSSRRDGIVIRLWCECCGHPEQPDPETRHTGKWLYLEVAQHKGATLITWRDE